MRRYFRLISLILTLALFVLAAVIGGCSSNKQGTGEEKKQASAGKDVFNLRMQTAWAAGTQYQRLAEDFVQELEKAAGGRLKIKVFPDGGIVGAPEIFDAVSRGAVDMGHTWAGYWQGKEPAASLFASVPMGLTFDEYMVWMFQYNGVDLWQELYAKYNLVPLPASVIGNEVGYVSNKPINSLKDLKNMKVRNVGLAANVMTSIGAKVTPVTVAEFYQALERGVVDAGEYGTPKTNKDLGLHEVAKYWVMPGWHQPSSVSELLINKSIWEKLPDDLKQIIKSVSKSYMVEGYGATAKADAEALKELLDGKKIVLTRLSDEDLNTLRTETRKIEDDLAAKNPSFKKVLQSQRDFLEKYKPWANAQKF